MLHCRTTTIAPVLLSIASLFLIQSCAINPNPRYTTDHSGKSDEHTPYLSQSERDAGDESLANLLSTQNHAENAKLAESIGAYLEARYEYGGNDAEAIDCSGFVKAVFEEVYGLELPRKAAAMYRLGTKVEKAALDTGDLVFFSTARWRSINHVGIYLSDQKFVHVSTSQGVTISSLDEDYWRRRYMGGRRL